MGHRRGESGFGARPMKREWVISIRQQCRRFGVPFFFKRWGAFEKRKPGDSSTAALMMRCLGLTLVSSQCRSAWAEGEKLRWEHSKSLSRAASFLQHFVQRARQLFGTLVVVAGDGIVLALQNMKFVGDIQRGQHR